MKKSTNFVEEMERDMGAKVLAFVAFVDVDGKVKRFKYVIYVLSKD